jgi:hypothetical protein
MNRSFFEAIFHFKLEDGFDCYQTYFLDEEISQISLFKKSLNSFNKKN